jgi:hypothetical protein
MVMARRLNEDIKLTDFIEKNTRKMRGDEGKKISVFW